MAAKKSVINPWTGEQIALLGSGLPIKEIAKRTGRTEGAVNQKKSTLNRAKITTKAATGKAQEKKTGTITFDVDNFTMDSEGIHIKNEGFVLLKFS